MDIQEVFDTVVNHLITQGKQSIEGDICQYRLGDLKCAVGVLIPDELYDPKMENYNLHGLISDFRDNLPPLVLEHSSLLSRLQEIHDNHNNWNENGFIIKSVYPLARHYGLDYSKYGKKK